MTDIVERTTKALEQAGWKPMDSAPIDRWFLGRWWHGGKRVYRLGVYNHHYGKYQQMPGAWSAPFDEWAEIDQAPLAAVVAELVDEVKRLREERAGLIEGLVKVEHTAMQKRKASWKDAQIDAIRRIAHNHLAKVGIETLAPDDPRRALLPEVTP